MCRCRDVKVVISMMVMCNAIFIIKHDGRRPEDEGFLMHQYQVPKEHDNNGTPVISALNKALNKALNIPPP